MYFLVDSLLLDQLRISALEKSTKALAQHWVSKGLLECTSEVFSNTVSSDETRITVVRIDLSIATKTDFAHLITEDGDLAIDIMEALVQLWSLPKAPTCPPSLLRLPPAYSTPP